MEADLEERRISLPVDLKRLFIVEKDAKAIFNKLPYTHQKEYVQWSEEG